MTTTSLPTPIEVGAPTRPVPRVLFVATDAATIRAFLLPFADHLRATGWRVDGMAADIRDNDACAEAFDRLWDVPWERRIAAPGNASAIARVRDVLLSQRFDLVHVHTPIAAALTRLAVRGIRPASLRPLLVYTAHGFHFRDGPSTVSRLPYRWVERLCGTWTDHLIVINRRDAELARRFRIVPRTRLEHMPGIGVDPDHFSAAAVPPEDLARVRADLPLDANVPLFTLIGELVPRKRQTDAIGALAAMARRDAHLVLIGGGSPTAREAVTAHARELGVADRVHLIGRVADVRPYVLASDALLQVSDREGLPRSVMESMSLGIPAIGTDTPGTTDLLDEGRGYLVPVGDRQAIARAMDSVLGDGAAASARADAALAHVHSTLHLSGIIERHDATYGRLLAGAGVL